MQKKSFHVLFFLKKAKLLKNGEASVCMRITIDKQRVETRIGKSVEPKLWNQAKECSRGKDRQSQELNNYIEEARAKVFRLFQDIRDEGRLITAKTLAERFFGQDEESNRTLLSVFKEHNNQCTKLIGIDYAAITINRYRLCREYLGELIKQKYNKEDLLLKEINGEFVRSFGFYLKTEKGCAQNTRIVGVASNFVSNKTIKTNPPNFTQKRVKLGIFLFSYPDSPQFLK